VSLSLSRIKGVSEIMSEIKTVTIESPKKLAMIKQTNPNKAEPTIFPAESRHKNVSSFVKRYVKLIPLSEIIKIIIKEIIIIYSTHLYMCFFS
jgi:hypothetical protein